MRLTCNGYINILISLFKQWWLWDTWEPLAFLSTPTGCLFWLRYQLGNNREKKQSIILVCFLVAQALCVLWHSCGHFYVQKVLELLSISWIRIFVLSQLTGNQTMGINFWWGQHSSQETLFPMSKSHWAFLQSNEGPRNTTSIPTARSLHCLESGPTADTIFRTSEIRAGRRRATWQSVFWPWTCFGVGGGSGGQMTS